MSFSWCLQRHYHEYTGGGPSNDLGGNCSKVCVESTGSAVVGRKSCRCDGGGTIWWRYCGNWLGSGEYWCSVVVEQVMTVEGKQGEKMWYSVCDALEIEVLFPVWQLGVWGMGFVGPLHCVMAANMVLR